MKEIMHKMMRRVSYYLVDMIQTYNFGRVNMAYCPYRLYKSGPESSNGFRPVSFSGQQHP